MRCETTTIWPSKSTAREVWQTSASCGRSFHLRSSKVTGFCVITVVLSVGLGSEYEMFQWHLLCHTTVRAKGVAELSSLKCYNRSKCGLPHRVVHHVGQIPMAAITENRFCDRVITNFVS